MLNAHIYVTEDISTIKINYLINILLSQEFQFKKLNMFLSFLWSVKTLSTISAYW